MIQRKANKKNKNEEKQDIRTEITKNKTEEKTRQTYVYSSSISCIVRIDSMYDMRERRNNSEKNNTYLYIIYIYIFNRHIVLLYHYTTVVARYYSIYEYCEKKEQEKVGTHTILSI
mmetsp:Transcript_42617/g.47624  ORF Transcript_42617/g.47624 Transcript_42617/m.47624 type:complete len:116 (+) Transcript_42617:2457-2804(+)